VLSAKLEKIGLSYDEQFYERCDKFVALLQQWGAVHSLTAQLKREQIEANIIDSIYPMKFINEFESLADIGTGAGYPGMLLAIANPDKKVALIEPKAKRVAFLNFVKNALKLENVEVIQKRVEELSPRSYDIITSRAVTNTALLLSLTNTISGNDTEYLFYKGSICKEEIEEAKLNNYEVIPNGEHRNFLYIKRKGLFDDI
jgi:16S rRNA (guanine527-N7)-methyltransferase